MKNITILNERNRRTDINGRLIIALLATTVATLAVPAWGAETSAAVALDDAGAASVDDVRVVRDPVSANGARRAAYRYLAELGYSRGIGLGTARVRSVTREGDTWILSVAYSRNGRVMSGRAMLYVDAASAMVSEVPPSEVGERLAAR